MVETPTPARPALDAMAELMDDVDELRAYFEDRADITDNGGPNRAMKAEIMLASVLVHLRALADMREALTKVAGLRGQTRISMAHGTRYSFGANDAYNDAADIADAALARSAP